jgi:hypothetical protein
VENFTSFLDSLHDCIHSLQRHDIIKKRLDNVGKTIDSRKDGVGGPKVFLSSILCPISWLLDLQLILLFPYFNYCFR